MAVRKAAAMDGGDKKSALIVVTKSGKVSG